MEEEENQGLLQNDNSTNFSDQDKHYSSNINEEYYYYDENTPLKQDGFWGKPKVKVFVYHFLFVFLSIVYLSISVGLPYLNKAILSSEYQFPLTSSLFQTMGAIVILLIFNLAQYRYQSGDLVQKSYFFDKNFIKKSYIMIPVSICFAAVMILTNVGIQKIPVDYHVVFKSTNIIWVVLFSILINKEKPSIYEYVSIGLLMAGTILVSLAFADQSVDSWVPIVINLLGSFAESLSIVVLKWTCTYLYRIDDTMSVIEISLFKVVQGSIGIFIPMLIVEGVKGFKVLSSVSQHQIWLLVAGIFVTMVFQTCTVWLSKSMYSTTVGVISQLQIIPQTIINIIAGILIVTSLRIVGVILTVLGCTLFSMFHFSKIYPISNCLPKGRTCLWFKNNNV
ncbi:hypothetical protein ACTFIT_008216 [Dictyostelium discoideum]